MIRKAMVLGANATMREYKREIELLKNEIVGMENGLGTTNDENVKVLNPMLIGNFDTL